MKGVSTKLRIDEKFVREKTGYRAMLLDEHSQHVVAVRQRTYRGAYRLAWRIAAAEDLLHAAEQALELLDAAACSSTAQARAILRYAVKGARVQQ